MQQPRKNGEIERTAEDLLHCDRPSDSVLRSMESHEEGVPFRDDFIAMKAGQLAPHDIVMHAN